MKEKRVVPGQFVVSSAGRDRGRFYLVTEVTGDRYVMVADGEIRRVESPKKKNVKHLCVLPKVHEGIAGKLGSGMKITNAEVRRAISEAMSELKSSHSKEGGTEPDGEAGCY